MKTLLDFLVEKGYSSIDAKNLIMTGKVYVNGIETFIPSTKIKDKDQVKIISKKKWVSRGALKLLEALSVFKISVENKVVLDIGASTGGFTEVLLKKHAKKIYALDVGKNLLDSSLRKEKKIINLEGINLKKISKDFFDEKIDLVTVDVSFISLYHVFNVLKQIKPKKIIALIKPQFEIGKKFVKEGGIAPREHHQFVLDKVKKNAENFGFQTKEIINSPIKGAKSKNIEYLGFFTLKNKIT